MLRDANAARKVYDDFAQNFTNIQWLPRPEGKLDCRNIADCLCEHAMCWCHRCGHAYCLDCRSHGEACDHHICNYSSEIREQFVPDSIAAKDSTFSVADLVYDTLGQEAYFGAHRAEQSDYRRSAFDDLIDKCHEGIKVGNSYLQSCLKHGVEEYPFAEFVFELHDIVGEYLPCVSTTSNTKKPTRPCRSGVLQS